MPAKTRDGHAIRVLLNAGMASENHFPFYDAIDGVGLYRTEMAFLAEQSFPSEERQVEVYSKILSLAKGRPVVMRTLDIGGDKSLPYFPMEEENPFLGWRGIRFTLDHPDIFLIQIRAMLRASIGQPGKLKILLPMISGVSELDAALTLIEQAYHEVSLAYAKLTRPEIGVMLEVPSMIYLLPAVAPRIDFVSVGTNDLTQYLLAVDRNNAQVSELYQMIHPSVLLALQQIRRYCQQFNLPVSVCGELAGDPVGVLLLIGLGFDQMSVNPANVAQIKYVVRQTRLQELERLSEVALQQSYASDIYALVLTYLEQHDLAGFVRPGKH